MNFKLLAIAPVAAVFLGCASPSPVAQNFPLSYQKVARSAHHWDVVADDVVQQTLKRIEELPQLQGRGIFVADGASSVFDTAFRDFMITRFVGTGASVSVCKRQQDNKPGFDREGRDIEIQYQTQLVRHGEALPAYIPGALTMLGSGVAVVRNAVLRGIGEANAAIIGAGAVADFAAGHAALPTGTEIIITTSIAEGNRFLMRKSDVYYVPDSDARLFFQSVPRNLSCGVGQPVAPQAQQPREGLEAQIAREEMIRRDMKRFRPGN